MKYFVYIKSHITSKITVNLIIWFDLLKELKLKFFSSRNSAVLHIYNLGTTICNINNSLNLYKNKYSYR